jgi:hypothetical protein
MLLAFFVAVSLQRVRSLQISREIPRSDKSGEPSQELVTLACRGILENHA